MKVFNIVFLVFFLVASCAPMATAIPGADNFSLVFTDYSCSTLPLNVLDTKAGTLTHIPLHETTPITITLRLSDSQLEEIYQKLTAMDFFSFPAEFVIPPEYETISEVPFLTYELSVTNEETTNTVHWTIGGLSESRYEKANQFWELINLINTMIYNHPEYKQLPEPTVGCA